MRFRDETMHINPTSRFHQSKITNARLYKHEVYVSAFNSGIWKCLAKSTYLMNALQCMSEVKKIAYMYIYNIIYMLYISHKCHIYRYVGKYSVGACGQKGTHIEGFSERIMFQNHNNWRNLCPQVRFNLWHSYITTS